MLHGAGIFTNCQAEAGEDGMAKIEAGLFGGRSGKVWKRFRMARFG